MNNSHDLSGLLYGTSGDQRRWLMSHSERTTVLHVLSIAQPVSALEVGTAHGGCLQHIRQHARRTYSIDISPDVRSRLAGEMPEVEFMTGDSKQLIGEVLRLCAARAEPLGFVLIDGDHTYGGVKADLQALLAAVPSCALWVLMHDSANPDCRRGIVDAPWDANPHVHLVELDFVPGTLSEDPQFEGMLWGGLALALLLPQRRERPLTVTASAGKQYAALYRASRHYPSIRNSLATWLAIKRRGLARRLGRAEGSV